MKMLSKFVVQVCPYSFSRKIALKMEVGKGGNNIGLHIKDKFFDVVNGDKRILSTVDKCMSAVSVTVLAMVSV